MAFLAKIYVSLKPTANDPQGQTVLGGLGALLLLLTGDRTAVRVAGGIGFFVLIFVGGMACGSAESPATAEGAQVGDHIHASVRVEICGDWIDLPPSSGGIHSHGDGQAHIHPQNSGEAGSNANLGRFFDGFPMVLGSTRIQVPGGELHENGKPCPDGEPGTVRVEINGKDSTETFKSHVFREADRVKVSFK